MFQRKSFTGLIAVLLLAMLLVTAFSGSIGNAAGKAVLAGKAIKIGVFVPLSGTNADKGKRVVDALKLAVEEINGQGGILGGKIDLIAEDDEGVPAKSVTAVTKLITSDNVCVVFGSVPSSCTIAAMVVTEKNQIPQIAANSSSPKIPTMGDKYIFQTIPNDTIQAAALANFAIKEKKYKKIAILNANDDYGMGGMKAFSERAKALKVETLIQSYNPGDKEFTAQIVKIKEFNPQAIVIWGMQTEAALFMKQARQQGITAQFLGAGGISGQTFVDLSGSASEGTIVTTTFMPNKADPKNAAFVDKFQKKFGYEPDLASAQPYDAMYALKPAIEKAKSLDPVKIRDAYAATKGFKGVTGELTFASDNSVPTKPVIIVQLKNQKWVFVKAQKG